MALEGSFDWLHSLSRRGEMGARIRNYDWESTPLGPPSTWPQSLRSALSICLGSSFQIGIYWGQSLTLLYNDEWSQIAGRKHPWALGRAAREVWPEIWETIGPLFDRVLTLGEATRSHDQLLAMHRRGFTEECYFDYTFSPIRDEADGIGGVFNIAVETTFRVIGERRTRLLKDLGELTTRVRSAQEVCSVAAATMSRGAADLPFCLIYLVNPEEPGWATLAGVTGLEEGTPASPRSIRISEPNAAWPIASAIASNSAVIVDSLSEKFNFILPGGPWPERCERAVVVPLPNVGVSGACGSLVVGISPRLELDDEYRAFLERLGNLTATAVANARAYEEERRRAEALAELDRAKTAFFSNVSHELRTPLTLMLAPVQELLATAAQDLKADHLELLRVIHRSGLRLQRLVNTLLDFSRIEAGRAQATYEATELASFTADLASSFRSAMERAGLQFVIDCAPLSEDVYVDREMWEKIVLNLLSNALNYTLQGSVCVRLRECGGQVAFSVTDTGTGIPEREIPRLFDRFHRVEGSRGRTHEGTGIGLALVQELVRMHGGSMAVSSALGKGSTFTVSLPLGRSHLPAERIRPTRSLSSTAVHANEFIEGALLWLAETQAGTLQFGDASEDTLGPNAGNSTPVADVQGQILLADDNADMRRYLQRLLSSRYDVTAVSNGQEALKAALARPPDLVLTDVMMPVLDGFRLLQALRENERTKLIPVLLLSARAGEGSRVEGLRAGADDYLVKPFTARELLARVDAHLSLSRMRMESAHARRLSEARIELAVEATKLFAWEWNPHTDAIHGWGDMAGIFGTVLTGSADCAQLVHSEDAPAHRAQVERIAREGGTYHAEFRIRRADTGAIAWLEERATAIDDDDGSVLLVVGVIADVSDRKHAEDELRRANERLRLANTDLEQFAYSASHDLREPIRMVTIYSQLLDRKYRRRLDEQADEYLDTIIRGAQRMDNLVSGLLSYVRATGTPEQQPPLISADVALDKALSNLETAFMESGATLVRSALPHLRIDEVQLVQVFQNLIGNAIKYRGREALRILVSAQPDGPMWRLCVRDNGIGIPFQYREQVFGLFKRLHNDRQYSGTGIGLALCRRIVQRNGGQIWVESEGTGCGTALCFTLQGEESVPTNTDSTGRSAT